MNKLATELIRLGNSNPELQKHLRPILDVVTKQAANLRESSVSEMELIKKELQRTGLWSRLKWKEHPSYNVIGYEARIGNIAIVVEYEDIGPGYIVSAKDLKGLWRDNYESKIDYERQSDELDVLIEDLKRKLAPFL